MIIRLDDLTVRLVELRNANLSEQQIEIAAARNREPPVSLLPAEATALAWLVRARAPGGDAMTTPARRARLTDRDVWVLEALGGLEPPPDGLRRLRRLR